jgi:hypothetical protein
MDGGNMCRSKCKDEGKAKRGRCRKFFKVVTILSIIGGVGYALAKKLKGDADDGWVSHDTGDSYVANPLADVAEDIVTAAEK